MVLRSVSYAKKISVSCCAAAVLFCGRMAVGQEADQTAVGQEADQTAVGQEADQVAIPTQPIESAEHWTPYMPPDQAPASAQVHLIVAGDTLWDLAAQYLDDPYLWPQLWEANPYITDPDLIYPGR